jgi:ankyrin repeat protein
MVELLLRRGAKLTLPDDPPWATPLAWATRRGHDEIVRLLTEYERTGSLPTHKLEEYEALAEDLVEAYHSGDDAALRRVIDHFQLKRMMTWDQPSPAVRIERLRRHVRERLGGQLEAENESDTLALSDAQLLIARSLGFGSWDELATHLENK